jgi:hypothetical protein
VRRAARQRNRQPTPSTAGPQGTDSIPAGTAASKVRGHELCSADASKLYKSASACARVAGRPLFNNSNNAAPRHGREFSRSNRHNNPTTRCRGVHRPTGHPRRPRVSPRPGAATKNARIHAVLSPNLVRPHGCNSDHRQIRTRIEFWRADVPDKHATSHPAVVTNAHPQGPCAAPAATRPSAIRERRAKTSAAFKARATSFRRCAEHFDLARAAAGAELRAVPSTLLPARLNVGHRCRCSP